MITSKNIGELLGGLTDKELEEAKASANGYIYLSLSIFNTGHIFTIAGHNGVLSEDEKLDVENGLGLLIDDFDFDDFYTNNVEEVQS